jgi:hypothetical protein
MWSALILSRRPSFPVGFPFFVQVTHEVVADSAQAGRFSIESIPGSVYKFAATTFQAAEKEVRELIVAQRDAAFSSDLACLCVNQRALAVSVDSSHNFALFRPPQAWAHTKAQRKMTSLMPTRPAWSSRPTSAQSSTGKRVKPTPHTSTGKKRKPVFDLKASLAKKPSWTMKVGRLTPGEGQENAKKHRSVKGHTMSGPKGRGLAASTSVNK